MKAKKPIRRDFGNDFDDMKPKSVSRSKQPSSDKKSNRKLSIYDDFDDESGNYEIDNDLRGYDDNL
ncbi:MAG: hypothetical protein Q8862_12225 [Bacteroidota bacterium]|nr:hypothetical protein [Bacteroidota bacterium]MDP4204989.1 hypothetical protein [Bacteroidota bacterium]